MDLNEPVVEPLIIKNEYFPLPWTFKRSGWHGEID
jgi:hypothetical protein